MRTTRLKPGETVDRHGEFTLLVEHSPERDEDGEPVDGPEWLASLHGPGGFYEARGINPREARARLRAEVVRAAVDAVRARAAVEELA